MQYVDKLNGVARHFMPISSLHAESAASRAGQTVSDALQFSLFRGRGAGFGSHKKHRQRRKGNSMQIDVIPAGHTEREAVEQFIHDRFAREYGADVRHFMPQLLRLSTDGGDIIAAAGYRAAGESRLFLENYLDEPIEAVVSKYYGRPIARESIVEVGNMAEAYPGAGRASLTAWTAFLCGMGYNWSVFTGVKKLRNGFRRVGIRTEVIAEADPSRLNHEELKHWGNYYEAGPMIMAGNLSKGYWSLRFAREILQPLWRKGMQMGKAMAREERGSRGDSRR